jgi:hypothetical protein
MTPNERILTVIQSGPRRTIRIVTLPLGPISPGDSESTAFAPTGVAARVSVIFALTRDASKAVRSPGGFHAELLFCRLRLGRSEIRDERARAVGMHTPRADAGGENRYRLDIRRQRTDDIDAVNV